MKKAIRLLIVLSLVCSLCSISYAGPEMPPEGSAGNEMGMPPGESGGGEMEAPPDGGSAGDEMGAPPDGGSGDAMSEGESAGESGESAAVEDDGIDAAITISDEGENKEREQTEGFALDFCEGGSFDETGINGFLFSSGDPAVNFYYSELSDNKESFFRIGGTASNYGYEQAEVSFSQPAMDWMSSLGIDSYDSAILLKDGGQDSACEPVISAKGWTYLDINGLLLYAEGTSRSAVYSDVVGGSTVPGPGAGGPGGGSQTPVVVIRNSLLETTGFSGADINTPISFGNSGGRARGIQPQGMSATYLYHSAIVSRTWGAYSTDSARQNLDLVSYKSMGYSTSGYGAYADTSCHLYLYGSNVTGSSDGITASNDGEIYAVNSECTMSSTELRALMGKKASVSVSPADYMQEDTDETLRETVIAGGSTAVQFHMPDQMHQGAKNTRKATLYMQGGTLKTDEAYLSGELSPYTARFSGSLLVTKSTQANVLLEGTDLISSNNVLIHSMINSDTNVNNIPDGEVAPGSDYTFRSMNAVGNIINEDYQRAMRVVLDDTVLSGTIRSNTCEDWNAFCTESLDGAYILNPDGYQTIWGVELTLMNGSVWNVSETSTLTALSVGEDCTINGTVTENADGTFTVEPIG